MIVKKELIMKLKRAIIGLFFTGVTIFSIGGLTFLNSGNVYADPPTNTQETTQEATENTENTDTEKSSDTSSSGPMTSIASATENDCKTSLGAIGWLVCPTTGKIAEAVDWLYDKIEDILVIDPVPSEEGTPVFEIWKYCRAITNIVFIIFLLIVIYSQITGLGINNYGVKKALPKLIVAAIMVNLSFIICSLAVDLSNIVGSSLRGLFSTIAESAVAANTATSAGGDVSLEMKVSYANMYSSLAGGAALAIGAGVIAFETGAIWMLIPVVLGAIVAVASGLITIALRQAVVTLLIMISPLAMVANVLPNTEQWFKKWKDLFAKMLVFYPMFSLLFGASNLAGFALVASAKDGFTILLGIAVQVFPLFFSWSLMKMSGTFLGTINAKLRGIAAQPLATNRAWADSHRRLTGQRFLSSGNVYTPSLKLRQFLENRKVAREAEISESEEYNKKRGLAYYRRGRYNPDGSSSRRGIEAYRKLNAGARFDQIVTRDDNNMDRGLGEIRANKISANAAKLAALDRQSKVSFDALRDERERGEKIRYENAVGYYNRKDSAINAHMDMVNGFNSDGTRKSNYKFHFEPGSAEAKEALERYNRTLEIMDGNVADTQYVAAAAAHGFDTQKKIYETKVQKYFDTTPPSADVSYRLKELTDSPHARQNIDAIISGFRVLNQRGDTDILKDHMNVMLNKNGGINLGTHASQALASFLMFEVKDNDPFLRRFGKYINLETARVFNSNDRKKMNITYDEYLRGYHIEPNGEKMVAKKPGLKLIEGTSFDNIERTSFSSFDDSLKEAYGFDANDTTKKWDVAGYLKKREEYQTAFEPAFLSANLKYLSGSEQINSAIKFWTGYELKQKKKNGKVLFDKNDNPVYEWSPVWNSDEYNGHNDEVEKYYRRKTYDFFKDQTVNQVLGMRTDYREPTKAHLMAMYFDDDDREIAEAKKKEYEKRRAEIQTRYGDEDIETAQKKRNADMKKLDMEIAGKQLRVILDNTGKLEQIYNMRRSGVTSGTKDWMRGWLNLDNKAEIFKYLAKKDKEREKDGSSDVTGDDADGEIGSRYDSEFKAGLMASLQDIYDRTDSKDDEVFYNESLAKLENDLGKDSFVVKAYKDFKERYDSADRKMCFDEIDRLITEL